VSEALSVLSPVPVVLQDLPVRIDRDEVLRFQGYKTRADVPTREVWPSSTRLLSWVSG
jgi:hypothetical protein